MRIDAGALLKSDDHFGIVYGRLLAKQNNDRSEQWNVTGEWVYKTCGKCFSIPSIGDVSLPQTDEFDFQLSFALMPQIGSFYFEILKDIFSHDGMVKEFDVQNLNGENIQGFHNVIRSHNKRGGNLFFTVFFTQWSKKLEKFQIHFLKAKNRINVWNFRVKIIC